VWEKKKTGDLILFLIRIGLEKEKIGQQAGQRERCVAQNIGQALNVASRSCLQNSGN
jgi:hypothetical protein